MASSNIAKARRALAHLQVLLRNANDHTTRERLKQKCAGARQRLETLERNHDQREAKAVEIGATAAPAWWTQVNRPRSI